MVYRSAPSPSDTDVNRIRHDSEADYVAGPVLETSDSGWILAVPLCKVLSRWNYKVCCFVMEAI